MRCALSTVITRCCSVIWWTVLVLGTSTSMPDCRMGAVIMKMMSRTSTTSMNGTMLISESDVCVCLICGMWFTGARWRPRISVEGLLDLRGYFQREAVQPLGQIANILQKVIIEDDRGNGGEKSRRGGEQRFGNTGSHGAEGGRAGVAEAGKGINDAPDGAEETDEGGNRGGGGKPGHAFLGAPHFFRGG